jgi:ribosomal protein L40E
MRSSKCNKDNPSDASFCEGCGTKLELICPACKASVSPGARFCKKCGTALLATRPDSHQAGPSESPIRVTADSGSASGAIEGEPKMVTALFADIKGSTELMESLDPEQAKCNRRSGASNHGQRGTALRRLRRAVHRRLHLFAVRRAGRARRPPAASFRPFEATESESV